MKKRIWELDMLRGIFMILIMLFHLWYDLVYLYGVAKLDTEVKLFFYGLGNDWGGTPFLLISGLCATIGSRPVKRGLQVIGGGMIISAVTAGMYFLNFAGKGIIIYFGVLHCIGVCMLLWPLFKKLPTWAVLLLGIVMAAAGLYLKYEPLWIDSPWLTIFGIPPHGFVSSDYFPLLPWFFLFLTGYFLYDLRRREPFDWQLPVVTAMGRHSLVVYLAHQPVIYGVLAALHMAGIL